MNKILFLSLATVLISSSDGFTGNGPESSESDDSHTYGLRNTRGDTIYIKSDDPHWDEKVFNIFGFRPQEKNTK